MKTNKKKVGSNFYEVSNVKNKRDRPRRKDKKVKHQTMVGASFNTKPLSHSLVLQNPVSLEKRFK